MLLSFGVSHLSCRVLGFEQLKVFHTNRKCPFFQTLHGIFWFRERESTDVFCITRNDFSVVRPRTTIFNQLIIVQASMKIINNIRIHYTYVKIIYLSLYSIYCINNNIYYYLFEDFSTRTPSKLQHYVLIWLLALLALLGRGLSLDLSIMNIRLDEFSTQRLDKFST